MATTATEIANFALGVLGSKRISDIEDGTSKNARIAKLHYARARQATLRRGKWNFATRRKTLTAHADAPVYGYTYQFPLPEDYLRMMVINEVSTWESQRADWFEIENGQDKNAVDIGPCLLINADSVRIRYIGDVTDTNAFDALFVEALTTYLAAKMARAITGSDKREAALLAQFEQMDLPTAQQVDGSETRGNENPPLIEALANSFFVQARSATSGVETPEPAGPTPAPLTVNPALDEVDVSGTW